MIAYDIAYESVNYAGVETLWSKVYSSGVSSISMTCEEIDDIGGGLVQVRGNLTTFDKGGKQVQKGK